MVASNVSLARQNIGRYHNSVASVGMSLPVMESALAIDLLAQQMASKDSTTYARGIGGSLRTCMGLWTSCASNWSADYLQRT